MILAMAAGMFTTVMPVYGATMTCTYDAAGRLAGVDYGEGSSIAYTYDPSGSLLQKVITANVTLTDAISTFQVLSGADPVKPCRERVSVLLESKKAHSSNYSFCFELNHSW